MPPEHFWWGGWWIFPILMPIIMLLVFLVVLRFVFPRGEFRPRWWDEPRSPRYGDSTDAIQILKTRYAKGEITRTEYEQMKKDLET